MALFYNNAIIGASGNQGGAGGYQISRSLRFNSADSAYLSRTPASAGNRKTWTWSGWVKRSAISFSAEQHLWGVTGTTDATYGEMFFGTGDTLRFAVGYNTTYGITTTRVFRDASAWYHIALAFDATQSTAANKIKLYINGVEETTFSSDTRSSLANQDWGYNNNVAHYIGRNPNSDIRHFDGYLADIHFIDGQALDPTSFTEVDATTGQLKPKAYSGSFGTNGFWLKFSDNSAATATTLGKDYSGNSNNFTPNNLSVTAGAGNDSLVDTPTSYGVDAGVGGEVRGNYATLNPLQQYNSTLSNGNLDVVLNTWPGGANPNTNVAGTIAVSSDKYYWEVTATTVGNAAATAIGIAIASEGSDATNGVYYLGNGNKVINGSSTSYGSSYTSGNVIGVALDITAGTVAFYKDNTTQGAITLPSTNSWKPKLYFSASSSSSTVSVNFGQRPFAYTAPSGFKALCDTNLPAPVVAKPSTVMDVKLYTGNGSTQTISGLGFSPDLVWMKVRSTAYNHTLIDSVRGATKTLSSSMTVQEYTEPTGPTAFTSDGWSMSGDVTYVGSVNANGQTYAGWCWDAGTSTVTLNPGDPGAGSITTSVRANASSGFSVVSWSGVNGANGTIGHGLGVAPQFVILKNRGTTDNWRVYHVSVGATGFLQLASTGATVTSDEFQNTPPTSSVFYLRGNTWNAASNNYIGYFFAPVAAYSAFGSYTGNGSTTDNTFVYTGMRPRFVMLKRSDSTGNWVVWDAARNSYNVVNSILLPNTSAAEYSPDAKIDILSNGFKVRDNSSDSGTNGATYIYAAFAENPFQYARAR